MKAYQVTNNEHEDTPSVIVFTDSHTKAKTFAKGLDGFDCDWIEMSVTRLPEADKYWAGRTEGPVLWSNKEDIRIYWELEWTLFEAETCESCGRFECEMIPESKLERNTTDYMECEQCRNCEKEKEA